MKALVEWNSKKPSLRFVLTGTCFSREGRPFETASPLGSFEEGVMGTQHRSLSLVFSSGEQRFSNGAAVPSKRGETFCFASA
eukprot:CAMPEP_0197190838 /NCGR_PEP_ID=MMETSP1423-20130617/22348_1 /TAXON_ID=476441 /ORGANISM="Pseudo-nitzschia heimii, Strain UNC1101" /LENGTH=81 /DNA_ID=CAMNT_0042643305 /DNA_START=58 /DNA_END=300 /DNA_ORIENTATION=+